MDLSNFKFHQQKIVKSDTGEQESYELLLRASSNQSLNHFPSEEFQYYVSSRERHTEYTKWLKKVLMVILNKNPSNKYSINLDHQELEYPDTFELLRALTIYNNRLIIEVTEVPGLYREGDYFSNINESAFNTISNLGYEIAFDDVGSGLNSIENFLKVKDSVSRIKLSLLPFTKEFSNDQLDIFIGLVSNICNSFGKDFIIEGIETEVQAERFKILGGLQQGYLYSKPTDIEEIGCWKS